MLINRNNNSRESAAAAAAAAGGGGGGVYRAHTSSLVYVKLASLQNTTHTFVIKIFTLAATTLVVTTDAWFFPE